MSKELIERLREAATDPVWFHTRAERLLEAADAIATLQAERDALRAELDGANETLRKCFGEDTAALVARALAAEQALADEREACAKVAESPDLFMKFVGDFEGNQIAAAIRSRASEDKR